MDEVDARILAILQEDGRISMRELGARVGLSGPGAAERVRRLEDRGVIGGYRAAVAPGPVGRPLGAFITLALPTNHQLREFEAFAQAAPEILECHQVTGDDCYLLRVALPDVAALQRLTARLSRFGRTRTSIVLGSPVEGKPLVPIAAIQDSAPTARPSRARRRPRTAEASLGSTPPSPLPAGASTAAKARPAAPRLAHTTGTRE